MIANPTLQTERLLLRPFQDGDVEALHSYLSLPEVCRWVPFEPQSWDECVSRVERKKANAWDTDADLRGIALAVVRRSDDRLIGDLVLFSTEDPIHKGAELGYSFHPEVAGQGYASESVIALLDWAFPELDLHRVAARVDTENEASWKLLDRLGVRREAHLVENEWFKGRWGDEYDYGLLASEWAGR